MLHSHNPEELLSRMTLAEKVGQIFIFTWINPAQARNDLRLHPGGFIRIYSDAITVARESAEIQQETAIPLIMAADFERGIGGTVSGAIEVVTAMALGATGNENAAFSAGNIIGTEALIMGINMDYVPVLDVNSNPLNPVINTRSYGSDPHQVARLGVAFMKGLQAAGLATCGKHFPGHGNTHVDSHSNLGTVSGNREQLEATELVPFKAAIAAGVDAIMSAHLLVPAIDEEPIPATLSRRIMTGLLRDELGFEGVAVSDALDMGAIAKNFKPEQSVPMAVNAGCDSLVMPQDNELVVDILISAVKRGEVSEERLNEAVLRNLKLKHKRGMLDRRPDADPVSIFDLNTRDHRDSVREIAEKSIVLLRGGPGLPLHADARVVCIEISTPQPERSYYLEPRSFGSYLAAGGRKVKVRPVPTVERYSDHPDDNWVESVSKEVEAADIVIIASYAGIRLASGTAGLPEKALAMLHQVRGLNLNVHGKQNSKPVILASFGNPYVVREFAGVQTVLCAFSETQASQAALARALRGEIQCGGNMPVEL